MSLSATKTVSTSKSAGLSLVQRPKQVLIPDWVVNKSCVLDRLYKWVSLQALFQ